MSKRKLTENEIEYILDFIKPFDNIPPETAMSIVKRNKDKLRKQLENQEIYAEIIDELKEEIKKNYFDALINPGESVGILCSQSLGEKNTQSTLNTFHKAGQNDKSVTAGVKYCSSKVKNFTSLL